MTDRAPLPDQAARDVITGAAEAALDETVFVDAGAGTGKTTALVARAVALVASGVPVDEIAAITFTEAAAAELRHRVRGALEEAARDPGRSRVEHDRLVAAAAGLDDTSFTTLHAFAQRILLDHPLEAGLPPQLELLSDIEEATEFDERWDAWVAEITNREAMHPALEQLDRLGLTIPKVRTLAAALHDQYHRIPPDLPAEPTEYEPPELDLSDVFDEGEALRACAEQAAATDPDDKLVTNLQECVAAVDRLRTVVEGGGTLDERLAALEAIEQLGLARGGKAATWGGKDEVSAVRAQRKAFRDEVIPAVVRQQHDHLLRALASWTAAVVLRWADDRRRRGVLVFDDLLVGARDLLRDDAEVRRRVRERHRHLLIDEFQDTDPIQIEIAVLLGAADHDALAAGPGPDGSVPWESASLEPGRLFFVGDPKQSIYRFRGADIGVYEGAKAFVEHGTGRVKELTHNFRSVPGVLDWVNAAFDRLLVARDRAQPAYAQLTGERDGGDAPAAVRWFGGPSDERSQATRDVEAAEVVDVVRSLVGRATVEDPDTGEGRPARAGDIAVLVRRHATARQLERRFDDAGLPLVVEARSLVFGTDEVRDLTTILTAIEDPNDQVAVLGALRHAAFGCSDAELVDWVTRRGGRWELLDPDEPPADHPVARGLHRLATLRADRLDHAVGGFVEHVITQLHLAELALARTRFRDRWRRIRFVADQAHAYHAAGGHLRGFVRWLREQADEGVRRDEHVVADADDDAVRVTTVHAAKGLEYPIVVVLGLDTKSDRPLHDPTLLWDDDGRPAINLGSTQKTVDYEDYCAEERTHHREEELRLLYVAATRARDQLVLSLHHTDRRGECHARTLGEMADDLAPWWEELDPAAAPSTLPSDGSGAGSGGGGASAEAGGAAAPRGDTLAVLEEFARERAEAVAEATRPRVLAATTIAAQLGAGGAPDGDGSASAKAGGAEDAIGGADRTQLPAARAGRGVSAETPDGVEANASAEADDGQPWRKGRSGSAIGRAVHAVLQTVDLATLDGIDALARVQCAAEGLPPGDATEVAAMARRAAEAPVVAEALAAGRYWRELHVGAPVAPPDGRAVTVEGFVDLLVETGDGLVVVDWKTDAARDRSPKEVVARYRPQAAAYAVALEAALDRPVARCVFVLTGVADPAGRQVEITRDDLVAATRELVGAL